MIKSIQKLSEKSGLPPGSLVYFGDQSDNQVEISITLIDYNMNECTENVINNIEDCAKYIDTPTVTWINVCGITDTTLIKKIGKIFGIHQLVLEDILNTTHRPKIEVYDDYLYTVIKMITHEEATEELKFEQVSIITLSNLVITLQEVQGDVFDSVRKRIRDKRLRIRKKGTDYLTYALIDAIVDNYFHVLENWELKIENLEDQILHNPTNSAFNQIYELKHSLVILKKVIFPIREMLDQLLKEELDIFKPETIPYVRDVYDHILNILDTIDNYREMLLGLIDTFSSITGNRLNEVMKVLTIISTIFIPLTFIAGIYGMNFSYIPELSWKYGYFTVWGVIVVITILMLIFFRRKKWL